MKLKEIIIFVLMILTLMSNRSFANSQYEPTISDYHATFIPLYDQKGNLVIAIRQFEKNATPYFLVVDSETLVTRIAESKNFQPRGPSHLPLEKRYISFHHLTDTPYFKALQRYTHLAPHIIQNDGITSAEAGTESGMFLTVDLCPSSHPFEKNFFETLVKWAQIQHHPIPVALSVSGLWIIGHPHEFQWLVAQQQKQFLSITWMNHSFSHIYYRDLPIEQNFFLHAQAPDLTQEVLDTEKLLLEHDQTPSVFFRFPGLVSNKKLVETLNTLGLIPVGSNAWLAKGEKPKNGSIILVHGNGNEPEGIKRFMEWLKQMTSIRWQSLPQLFKN